MYYDLRVLGDCPVPSSCWILSLDTLQEFDFFGMRSMVIVTADASVLLVVAGGAFAQVYVELFPNDGGVG